MKEESDRKENWRARHQSFAVRRNASLPIKRQKHCDEEKTLLPKLRNYFVLGAINFG
jgi:hypothetical protein